MINISHKKIKYSHMIKIVGIFFIAFFIPIYQLLNNNFTYTWSPFSQVIFYRIEYNISDSEGRVHRIDDDKYLKGLPKTYLSSNTEHLIQYGIGSLRNRIRSYLSFYAEKEKIYLTANLYWKNENGDVFTETLP